MCKYLVINGIHLGDSSDQTRTVSRNYIVNPDYSLGTPANGSHPPTIRLTARWQPNRKVGECVQLANVLLTISFHYFNRSCVVQDHPLVFDSV